MYKYITFPGIEENRYMINERGMIFDTNTNKYKPTSVYKTPNYEYYRVSIHNRITQKTDVYNVHVLVFYTFANLNVDIEDMDGIQLTFKDGNSLNVNFSNLKFKSNKYKKSNPYTYDFEKYEQRSFIDNANIDDIIGNIINLE